MRGAALAIVRIDERCDDISLTIYAARSSVGLPDLHDARSAPLANLLSICRPWLLACCTNAATEGARLALRVGCVVAAASNGVSGSSC